VRHQREDCETATGATTSEAIIVRHRRENYETPAGASIGTYPGNHRLNPTSVKIVRHLDIL